MTDYKRLQSEGHDDPEAQSEAERATAQLLIYMTNKVARKEFEDLVGFQAAFNTYRALMQKIARG